MMARDKVLQAVTYDPPLGIDLPELHVASVNVARNQRVDGPAHVPVSVVLLARDDPGCHSVLIELSDAVLEGIAKAVIERDKLRARDLA